MKEQKEVKVSKMVIQLTDEQISLSMNEAKKLYEALAELFGKKVVEHVYHHNDYWWYRPARPYYGDIYTSAQKSFGNLQAASDNTNSLKFAAATGMFEAKGSTLMCNLTEKK